MKKLLIFMFLLLTVFSYSKSTAPQANVAAAYKSLSVTRPVFADADVQKFADDYALFVQTFVYIMNTKDKNAENTEDKNIEKSPPSLNCGSVDVNSSQNIYI